MGSTELMTHCIAQKLLAFGGLRTLEDFGAETYIQASQTEPQEENKSGGSPSPSPEVSSHFYSTDL